MAKRMGFHGLGRVLAPVHWSLQTRGDFSVIAYQWSYASQDSGQARGSKLAEVVLIASPTRSYGDHVQANIKPLQQDQTHGMDAQCIDWRISHIGTETCNRSS